jgi:hypothetical protein
VKASCTGFTVKEPWDPAPVSRRSTARSAGGRRGGSRRAFILFYFATGALILLLGCLSRWTPLRTSVQAWLTSMGEGVAAAAGIAELIGAMPTKAIVGRAEDTLRAVRLDAVSPRHLGLEHCSTHEAYALSTPAPLGSIDVRAPRAGAARAPRACFPLVTDRGAYK